MKRSSRAVKVLPGLFALVLMVGLCQVAPAPAGAEPLDAQVAAEEPVSLGTQESGTADPSGDAVPAGKTGDATTAGYPESPSNAGTADDSPNSGNVGNSGGSGNSGDATNTGNSGNVSSAGNAGQDATTGNEPASPSPAADPVGTPGESSAIPAAEPIAQPEDQPTVLTLSGSDASDEEMSQTPDVRLIARDLLVHDESDVRRLTHLGVSGGWLRWRRM